MKAAVLGLGQTLKFLDSREFDFTVGVNDIYSRFKADYVVCVDFRQRFTPDRLMTIDSTVCMGFFSQLEDWRSMPNYQRINLKAPGPTLQGYGYSNNSPFVAVQVARKLGAKEIVLYGCDFHQDHKFFKHKNAQFSALQGFKELRKLYDTIGVKIYVGHDSSALSDVLPTYKK